MKALKRVLSSLDTENQRVGLIGSLLVDRFNETRAPADLQEAQDYIRLGLLHARAQLREEARRRRKRRPHFTARASRSPELGPQLERHSALLKSRVGAWERRRNILRATADALAWIALAHQPAAIARLFRPQTHDLPEQRGLIGHVLVQQAVHASGRFLVIENDLTRCLGLGDLTVVSLQALDVPPVSIEVKTKATKIKEGATADLTLALVEIDHPRAKEVLGELTSLIGEDFRAPESPVVPETKQLRSFFEQATEVIRAHAHRAAQLGVVEGNWSAVRRVLERALPGSPSLDIAEPGVWLAAIHATDEPSEFEGDLRRLRDLARARIPAYDSGRISFATTLHLEQNEFAGALTLPVAVWKLPPIVRAKVLNGDLILASFIDLEPLRSELEARGIDVDFREDGWTVRRDGLDFHMSGPAAARARLDTAFGGMSFRSLAARIDEHMGRTAAEAT